MNKIETIFENLSRAIQWAELKPFDPSFQGYTLKETASQGFDIVVKAYSNYFESITLIDSSELPENIAESLGEDYALLTEEYFIYSDRLLTKTDFQFFTPKSIIKAIQNKTVYLIKKSKKDLNV